MIVYKYIHTRGIIMKKLIAIVCGVLLAIMVTGCSSEESTDNLQPRKTADAASKSETTKTETEEKQEDNQTNIDTSAFSFAKSVEVTDARDTTKHINLVAKLDAEATQGLAAQNIFQETYKFLQQDDIKGADTVTIGVVCGDIRVAQITVDVTKFKTGDDELKAVLSASKIDKMNPDVKDYGKVMNLW